MNEINYIEPQQENHLYDDVCQIIDGARGRIATFVNTKACLTNWYVGKRIKEDFVSATQRQLTWTHLKSQSKEESPIGLILCSEGNTEHIEYLMLDEESPIKVAQYYTKLPDKKLLSEKLRKAIAIAKEHYNELSKTNGENDKINSD